MRSQDTEQDLALAEEREKELGVDEDQMAHRFVIADLKWYWTIVCPVIWFSFVWFNLFLFALSLRAVIDSLGGLGGSFKTTRQVTDLLA